MTGSESAIHKYTFYTTSEYWTELCRRLRTMQTGDKILLMTMTFDQTNALIEQVIQALRTALSRGAEVQIGIDAHSFLTDHGQPGPLWIHGRMDRPMRKIFQDKLGVIESLRTYQNCTIRILNTPARRFSIPIVGRSHIKVTLLNDDIFIGGCNMDVSDSIDQMVHWQDASSAAYLHHAMSGIIKAGHTVPALHGADALRHVDAQTKLLIDAGVRGQSAIYDQAINLIDSAEDWLTITCQFVPNGKTAEHLLLAQKRGVLIDVIYGHPSRQGIVGGLLQQVSILRERLRLPANYFKHGLDRSAPLLHAKLIACDRGIMIGSHNYVQAGVTLGTAEIALFVQSEAVARQSLETFNRAVQIGSATDNSR